MGVGLEIDHCVQRGRDLPHYEEAVKGSPCLLVQDRFGINFTVNCIEYNLEVSQSYLVYRNYVLYNKKDPRGDYAMLCIILPGSIEAYFHRNGKLMPISILRRMQ